MKYNEYRLKDFNHTIDLYHGFPDDLSDTTVIIGCNNLLRLGPYEKLKNAIKHDILIIGDSNTSNTYIFNTALLLMSRPKHPKDLIIFWSDYSSFNYISRSFVDPLKQCVMLDEKNPGKHFMQYSKITTRMIKSNPMLSGRNLGNINYLPSILEFPEDNICDYLYKKDICEDMYKIIYNKPPRSYQIWCKNDIHYDDRGFDAIVDEDLTL